MPKMSWGSSSEDQPIEDHQPTPGWAPEPDGFDRYLASLPGRRGPRGPAHLRNPSLQAQARAGEEDQSVPGWDNLP